MYNNESSTVKFMGKSALLTLFLLAATLIPFVLSADAAVRGGFNGPGPDIVTVKQALEMRDDSRLALRGNIVKSLGDEVYIFQDASGTIEVEIDHEVWRGLDVNPSDQVVISGEMDKDWSHRVIDVSSVTVEK